MATNISDEDAEATFQAMMQGVSLDMAKANADKANWLIAGATPQASGVGVVATVSTVGNEFPAMLPYMGTMHGAIGGEADADLLPGKAPSRSHRGVPGMQGHRGCLHRIL